MRPLSEHVKRQRQEHPARSTDGGSRAPRIAQYDGAGDDQDERIAVKDEHDEDAINSDLDDPEDPVDDTDEMSPNQEVMLCTYDKVQRVKNKWKCTLKDGILVTGGKEYVTCLLQG